MIDRLLEACGLVRRSVLKNVAAGQRELTDKTITRHESECQTMIATFVTAYNATVEERDDLASRLALIHEVLLAPDPTVVVDEDDEDAL